MTTLETDTRGAASDFKEQLPIAEPTTWRDRISTWWLVGGIIAIWVLLWSFTKGTRTLVIGGQATTDVHDWLQARIDSLSTSDSFFITITHKFGDFINWLVEQVQFLISTPDIPRPYPQIGWLGVVAIAAWVALALAGWRYMILVVASFLAFGYLGYFEDSIDTLILTAISVIIAIIIGIPLAIWMGRSKTATAFVTPVLDVLQTFPSFTYLFPLFLLFGLGNSCAVAATFIYALPPVARIAAHGIRQVSVTSIEATRSLGQSRWQEIRKVQLPMAKRTIIVGINQTTMAALSMVIIGAYVSGDGLGGPVLSALQIIQTGAAFVPGLCIVIMAIMLDRTTTAISERSERLQRAGGGNRKVRLIGVGGGAAVMIVCVYLSHIYAKLAGFPITDIGTRLADKVQSFTDWFTDTFHNQTKWIADLISYRFLNPLQDLLANSPWFLTFAAILALAAVLGGRWAALSTFVCLSGLYLLDLWNNSMVTLTMTLVATLFVMILAIVFGVWMGRSRKVDIALRPILDAGQTIPPFVYLIPVLALFGSTRVTAIVAAIAYAAPAAIKIVADGVRGVAVPTIEAALSTGSSKWQLIRKVQLPMSLGAVVLAANQGLLYVLSMAVIGGLVGAGALGYDIVAGFSQGNLGGRGLAASISVVLIGIMLDRITRRAALRV